MDAFSLFISTLIVFELFADIYLIYISNFKKIKHNLFIIDITHNPTLSTVCSTKNEN